MYGWCNLNTSNDCRNAEQHEVFPKIALLLQYDEDAIDQIIIDSILCRSAGVLGEAGCLRLCSDKGNPLSRFIFINDFLALSLTEILCLDQTSCNSES
jgi:hypothetical protein